jgi:Ctr copper transporter family
MQMAFTTSYNGVPILFEKWAPKTPAGFVGSLFAVGLAAFCLRALAFIRAHVAAEYWAASPGVRFDINSNNADAEESRQAAV